MKLQLKDLKKVNIKKSVSEGLKKLTQFLGVAGKTVADVGIVASSSALIVTGATLAITGLEVTKVGAIIGERSFNEKYAKTMKDIHNTVKSAELSITSAVRATRAIVPATDQK